MVAASIKFRTLKFNPKAAGVGSLLFYIALVGIFAHVKNASSVFSLLGAFTPTLYYIAFNGYREECSGCYTSLDQNVTKFICEKCHYVAVAHDPEHVRRVIFFSPHFFYELGRACYKADVHGDVHAATDLHYWSSFYFQNAL